MGKGYATDEIRLRQAYGATGFMGHATNESGGEPLCIMAALWVGSRRLPGTSRGVAVLWASRIRRTE